MNNNELMKSVILGTAGHIDHGKSSLVKALTGTDPDRLKEEKERGITIDLGFANLLYPDGLAVGIVDVPGHERLIKNMLAGAGGIDIVLMVIAADEGVMPQSREHLAICELLKIKAGIVAITKADLVDEEWLHLVIDDVRTFVKGTFLENAVLLPVSARSGLNLEALKEKIREVALGVEPKLVKGLFRLPIDRVFTLKGFGTVVTGTALSGTIVLDAPVEILPSRITSKVRGLQSHGKGVERAYAGQRIGINLQGIDRELLKRGDVVVTPDRFTPTRAMDAKLDMLKDAPPVKSRSLVHFYTGTAETIARIVLYDRDEVKPGESCYCQFRLEEPVVVLSGDRYIVRRFSPLETIGGGAVLDPQPVRRKRGTGTADLAVFEKGSMEEKIETKVRRAGYNGSTLPEIEGWLQGDIPEIDRAVEQLLGKGLLVKSHDTLLHCESFHAFREELKATLGRFHRENPLKPGMPKEELKAGIRIDQKVFNHLIERVEEVVVDREMLRLREFRVALSSVDENVKSKIMAILEKEGLQPSSKAELAQKVSLSEKELNDLLKLLVKEGALVRLNDSLHITALHYDRMMKLLKNFFTKKGEMTVAEFRDILGTTRKYALPLLEYLDSHRVTLRVGDVRKLMVK
ncbi:MAG: selenocysteine-specific translation elongation factor [Alphaproteobacteria bacterium]|uniref:Selenocysteine-specific elongation factor n=1 Tax=Candidatus Nitrobium versatile TaxID=2884831 RepID=A0A953J5Z5_9BACT|nr:selenocysteine-specific translation elongation factor [Candidatus Nitrobium versatile]